MHISCLSNSSLPSQPLCLTSRPDPSTAVIFQQPNMAWRADCCGI